MDSGEIEVISLHREPDGSLSPQTRPRRPRRTRTPRARRLLVTGGCAIALTLAIAGLLLSTQRDPHAALATLLGIPSPTPTATLVPGAAVFLVEHRVPWGVLTIDSTENDVLDIGRAIDTDLLDNPASFLLGRGRHIVVYVAPPFTTLRCTVSVPAAGHDTCPLVSPDEHLQRYVVGAARILDLGAVFDRLPAQPLADLDAAAAAAIGVSTPAVTAHAGDHYLGTDLQTHILAHDTRVSLFRQPWQGALPDGQTGCQFLCPGFAGSTTPSNVWPLAGEVREGYHYVPLTASAPPLADGPLAWRPDTLKQQAAAFAFLDSVPLDVTWDGAWHVTVEASNSQPLVCQAAITVLSNYATSSGPVNAVPQFQPLPAANQANGCAIGIQTFKPDGTKGSSGALLYRFGALLTTDATSSSLFPDLPPANSSELAIAQQILAPAR